MNNEQPTITKGQKVYYARILPSVDIYDVCDLIIRTVADDYFTGMDKHDKHAFLFNYGDIGNTIFFNRSEALEKVLQAEENRKVKTTNEKYYEEY